MTQEYVTVQDIAKALKTSKEFVYKHAEEFGGIRIGKKLLRFPKTRVIEILGVNDAVQTQGEMDVRFLEERCEVQTGRICRKTGRSGSRSKSEDHSQSDKYGLREIMRKQTGGY
jgi:hypothetical protein